MHVGRRGVEIDFDFLTSVLDLRTTDGETRHVTLEPRSVASFYSATIAALEDLDVRARMLARPVEVAESIPFAEDEQHAAYDAEAAKRFWVALVQAHRV